MTSDAQTFWDQRWHDGQTGFHEGRPNDLLVAHVDRLERDPPLRVLVPLSGKSEDLSWLAARGHEVVGVEFVRQAVDEFFVERGLEPREQALGPFTARSAGRVTMLCEDIFAITPTAVGTFDAIYDRAALVAIDPAERVRYVETCRALLRPGARTLLVGLVYPQSIAPGPPWSLDAAAIEALYGRATPLQSRIVDPPGRLAAAGVQAIEETAYLIE